MTRIEFRICGPWYPFGQCIDGVSESGLRVEVVRAKEVPSQLPARFLVFVITGRGGLGEDVR